MAEILIAKVTIRLAWQLFAPRTASIFQDGDIAEERLRQLLLTEFQKIHESLNALRRKELVSAVAFLETGFGVLHQDEKTAKEEFNKARNAAQMAFGVVADIKDKILATKILVTSTFHEFNDNLKTAESLCNKYLERLNTLPEVTRACEVIFSPEKSFGSKMFSLSGKEKREDILQGVADINKCVYDYFKDHLLGEVKVISVVRFGKYHINPITDMVLHRNPVLVCELDKTFSHFISVTISKDYIFAALGNVAGSAAMSNLTNDILAISLATGKVSHLLGHKEIVLDICSNNKNLFSGAYDKDIIVWDLETFQPLKVLSEHKGSVRSVCVSEKYLFSASTDNTIRVWELETYKCIHILETELPVGKVTCSRRKFLFLINGRNNIQIWDVNKFSKLHEFTVSGQPTNLIANDNVMYIPSKDMDQELILSYNLGSMTLANTLKEPIRNVTKTYNSPYIFCGNEKIRMLSTTSQRLIYEKEVRLFNERLLCGKVKFMAVNDTYLYVLCEHEESGRNFILRY